VISWDSISTSFEFSYESSFVARAENRFLLEKELVFCIFGLGEVGVVGDLIGTVCQLFVLTLLLTNLIGCIGEFVLFLVFLI